MSFENNYNLDSTADPMIRENVNEGIRDSAANRTERYSSGNQEARGLLNAPVQTNERLSYGDNATSAAIRSRYNKLYNISEHALSTSLMKSADADHIRKLQMASNAAGQEVEANRQKELLRWQIDQANKRARGQALGAVLGIGLGAAGAMSGPGMAMAGYGLGSGVGNLYGRSN